MCGTKTLSLKKNQYCSRYWPSQTHICQTLSVLYNCSMCSSKSSLSSGPPRSSRWPSLHASSPTTRWEGRIVSLYEIHMLSAAHGNTEWAKMYRCMLQYTVYVCLLVPQCIQWHRNMRPPVAVSWGGLKEEAFMLPKRHSSRCAHCCLLFVLSKSGLERLGLYDTHCLIHNMLLTEKCESDYTL